MKHNPIIRAQRDHQHAQAVAKAIRESTHTDQHITLPTRLPGDPWALRGIPVVGVHNGIGGATPGSRPDRT